MSEPMGEGTADGCVGDMKNTFEFNKLRDRKRELVKQLGFTA